MNSDHAIEVDHWTFAYTGGPQVLRGVSLSIGRGERVGLVGPNGAGKTTLLLGLAGVLAAPAGRICVCGLDPADPLHRRQLPARLGLCFQDPDDQLLYATLADDVAFGPLNLGWPRDEVEARTAEAIARVGLSGQEDRAPCRLSGGEKRRAALAGVLAMGPEVILLDEPTSSLDARGRRDLAELLVSLDATLLIASHDLEFVRAVCERTVILDGGQVMADGLTEEILADGDLLPRHGLTAF